MTLPNKLTMFRIVLIPLMVVIAYIPFFNENYVGYMSLANLINVIIFTVASLTGGMHVGNKVVNNLNNKIFKEEAVSQELQFVYLQKY